MPHIPLQLTPEFGVIPIPVLGGAYKLQDYLHYKGELWYPEGTEARGKFIMCNAENEQENCSNKN